MTNKSNTVVYVGVTNNLQRRVMEHKTSKNPKSFTAQYNCHKLVYYEQFSGIWEAIKREKQLKAGSRSKKDALINSVNPEWEDLAVDGFV